MNDHSDSWTEHQLVAAARGLPIPPPDEIPPQDETPSPTQERQPPVSKPADLSKPVPPRPSEASDDSTNLPASPGAPTLSISPSGATPLALTPGRTKPVASLSSTKNTSQSDIPRHEIQLPKNSQINGQPLEAYLYKDVAECPICFLYYPPYLNRTRCCDQPICTECFVQIKRPDPHPPEHNDPDAPPSEINLVRPLESEGQLISEPATCPFCKMPELGITYDSPPFRRGLAYVNDPIPNVGRGNSTASSKRPRGQSMSANHPDVITTDIVRPDWAMKLHEARRQQDRRSRAATALHQAAYNDPGAGPFNLDRFRRVLSADRGEGNSSGSGRGDPWNQAQWEQVMAMWNAQDSSRVSRRGGHQDLLPSRISSRDARVEDVEELLLRRAIQESIAAEEERRRKEDKEAEKERKKEEKKRAKEQKKADRAARKATGGSYASSANSSGFFHGTQPDQPPSPVDGKGKGRASGSPEGQPVRSGYQPGGFNPLEEPTSTLNSEGVANHYDHDSAQRHLEQSRLNLSTDANMGGSQALALPQTRSFSSSTDSSTGEVGSHQPSTIDSHTSSNASSHLPLIPSEDDGGNTGLSPNFNSLAEMIDTEGGHDNPGKSSDQNTDVTQPLTTSISSERRSRGASNASQAEPPRYQFGNQPRQNGGGGDGVGSKHGGNIAIIGHAEST